MVETDSPGSEASASDTVRSATRKATLHLIPLLAVGYACAYIDRLNVSFAALQMNQQLHFSPAVYGFGAGLFFIPYAACEIPSNLLLYRFGARRWLARIMFTWGVLAMLMALVRTPTQFYIARFLLGLAESGFFPGIIFYLMQWFPPDLRARSVSRFYISLPLSSVLMGLIAGPIMNLNGHLHLAGWQWLFVLEGLPPVLLALAFLKLLPDSPADAPWLTPAERNALRRPPPDTSAPHSPASLRAIFRDPRVWQIGLFNLFMLTSSYAYTFVAPDLLQHATHRSTSQVGFILAAMNLLGAVAMILGANRSDRGSEASGGRSHFAVIIPCSLLIAAGFLGCGLSLRAAVIIPSLTLLICSYMAIQGSVWAVPASFLRDRSGAAGVATINSIGILGGFLGPFWIGLARNLTGNYQRGMLVMSVPMVLGAAIMAGLASQSPRRAPQSRA